MANNLTIEELKKIISEGKLKCSENIIQNGKLINRDSASVDYKISQGWDVVASDMCDREWKKFNLELFEMIENKKYSDDELSDVLSKIQTQDSHWNWLSKSVVCRGEEYEWFYMFAEDKPQGACLIYHPKDSVIDSKNIFYIEFVAVAPWNRDTPFEKRIYGGIGSLLIKCALKFATEKLNLVPGFSLHSLPQSRAYYEKIGMKNYAKRDKKNLAYFELPRKNAEALLSTS